MLNLSPATLVARLIVLVIAFTVHEFAHAWTADWFGDDTPRTYGRLTLNPLAHLDFLGSLLILVSGFGWAKPVPINPYALQRRSPLAPMWVALAGPVSNLLLAALAAIPIRVGLVTFGLAGTFLPSASQLFVEFISLNLILMLFNLIPVYPLDGEKVLIYLLPPSSQQALERIRPYGPLILIGLIFIGPSLGVNLLNWIIGVPANVLFRFLIG